MVKGNFYNKQDMMYGHKRKSHIKLIAVGFFIFVIALFIFLTIMLGRIPFTGNVVATFDLNNSFFFAGDLGFPSELSIKGDYENLQIDGSNLFFYLSDKEFDLSGSRNNLINLNGFSGKIVFDSERIIALDGTVLRADINGLPVVAKNNRRMKIYSVGSFDYSSLNIREGVYIRNLDYFTSGNVRFGTNLNSIVIEGERFVLQDFLGNLNSERGKLSLNGNVKKIEIFGQEKISVLK